MDTHDLRDALHDSSRVSGMFAASLKSAWSKFVAGLNARIDAQSLPSRHRMGAWESRRWSAPVATRQQFLDRITGAAGQSVYPDPAQAKKSSGRPDKMA